MNFIRAIRRSDNHCRLDGIAGRTESRRRRIPHWKRSMIVTDSGVHVWRAAGPDRPWQPGRTAHLPTPIGYEDLRAMMDEELTARIKQVH